MISTRERKELPPLSLLALHPVNLETRCLQNELEHCIVVRRNCCKFVIG